MQIIPFISDCTCRFHLEEGNLFYEPSQERKIRIRLAWYNNNLQEEVSLFVKVQQHHMSHRKELMQEFEGYEMQLQSWGLFHILPSFRIQVSEGQLI